VTIPWHRLSLNWINAQPRPVKLAGAGTLGFVFLIVLIVAIWPSSKADSKREVASNSTPQPTTNSTSTPTTQRTPPTTTPEEPAVQPNGQLSRQVLQRVKRAALYLRVTLPDGGIAQGSGFLGVEPNIVLTNAHVIGMLEPQSPPPRLVEATLNSGEKDEKKFPCQVLGVDRDSDLAVLRALPATTVTLPAPLEVKSAQDLLETQGVYVFGFPFGAQLGKEISVGPASVAALRKDSNGSLRQVQLNGNMNPGNSGGPVVNSRGEVIGVSVAIISGTQINFAVPGDRVHSVCNGRVTAMSLGQAYIENGNTRVPVTIQKLDPLARMRTVSLEVWTGDRGQSRPSATAQPSVQAGDSQHLRLTLNDNRAQVSTGEVTLPALPGGKVYWVQPMWNSQAGDHWAGAGVYEMRSPPVERKPALLQVKHQAGDRPLTLTNRWTWRLGQGGEERNISATMSTHFQESTRGVDPQGTANVHLQYNDMDIAIKVGNEVQPRSARLTRLLTEVRRLAADLVVDRQGSLTRGNADVSQISRQNQQEVRELHGEIQQALEAFLVPMPNQTTQPLVPWRTTRTLPINVLGRTEPGTADMSYTYLGSRVRDGRQEALIGLTGQIRGNRPGRESAIAGRVEGTAVFDLAAGQVSLVDARISLDMTVDIARRPTKALGTLDVKLQRTLR
jgi:S1-C subfamily serine protease